MGRTARFRRHELAAARRHLARPEVTGARGLVRSALAALGIRDDFYPVGGAATYSLFYLLIRIAKELPVKNVLELGAGETTRLLDALRTNGVLRAECTTLEHDAGWAARVGELVSHNIVHTRLLEKRIEEIDFNANSSIVSWPRRLFSKKKRRSFVKAISPCFFS